MTDLERAREFFKNDLYATEATGIVIEAARDKYAKCSLKLDRRHQNAVGHTMGGVMFTLADFVFAIATNLNGPMTVSTVSQISFLSSPKGDTLFAETKLLRDGKHTCFYEVLVTDNLGADIAKVTISGSHILK